MIDGWQPNYLRPRGANYCGVLIQAYTVRVDDRQGGVGGSAVLRAIRAVSSASRARGQAL
jgi:hypothetical protein